MKTMDPEDGGSMGFSVKLGDLHRLPAVHVVTLACQGPRLGASPGVLIHRIRSPTNRKRADHFSPSSLPKLGTQNSRENIAKPDNNNQTLASEQAQPPPQPSKPNPPSTVQPWKAPFKNAADATGKHGSSALSASLGGFFALLAVRLPFFCLWGLGTRDLVVHRDVVQGNGLCIHPRHENLGSEAKASWRRSWDFLSLHSMATTPS